MPEPSLQERRREAFAKLLDDDGSHADDYAAEVEEDPRPFLSGAEEIGRFCAVTRHEGKHFYYPTFYDVEIAQGRAEEFYGDDTFDELPVKVVDLDTDLVWWARATYHWTVSHTTGA